MRLPSSGYQLSLIIHSQLVRTVLTAMLLTVAFVVFAAETGTQAESPDWLQLSLGLFGGLALFLAGLQELSEGMKKLPAKH